MKKKIISTLTIVALIMSPLFMIADTDGPGEPGGEPGGTPIGGEAPIGSGLAILIGLGAVYGGKKVYNLYDENKDTLED